MIAAHSVAELADATGTFLANLSASLEAAIARGEVTPANLLAISDAMEALTMAGIKARGASALLSGVKG